MTYHPCRAKWRRHLSQSCLRSSSKEFLAARVVSRGSWTSCQIAVQNMPGHIHDCYLRYRFLQLRCSVLKDMTRVTRWTQVTTPCIADRRSNFYIREESMHQPQACLRTCGYSRCITHSLLFILGVLRWLISCQHKEHKFGAAGQRTMPGH